ncbi:replication initiation protein, partial [Helicobacter turcicus]
MQEIVKYHNDFNKIKLPSFTEQEQNILMGIIAKIRDNPKGELIEFTPQELLKFSTENLTHKDLGNILVILKDKFFKADFKILIENQDEIGTEIINLFQKFTIWEWKATKTLSRVELQVNPAFSYLVNQITANFTRFELAEFIALSGKYTKTLYRLLKQYRQTGWAQWDFKEFKDILDIPSDYEMCNIDQRILKPALRELTQEQNLFDFGKRIPFQNLTYKKIKKGGNKVTAIRFDFTPEQVQEELEAQAEARIAE